MAESLANFRYYGLPVSGAMPRVFVAVDVELQRVLDLTQGANRKRLRIAESRLLKCDWPNEMNRMGESLTQFVGRAAMEAGFEAIRVRSSADPNGTNVVVFPANLLKSSRINVLNPDKLSM